MAISTKLILKFDGAAVQKGLAKLKSALSGLGAFAAKSLGILAAGAVVAGTALLATAVKINAIGEEARASNARLESITQQMGLFGSESKSVSDRLLELADTQGRLLGIDDDVIAATQSKLMTFKELAKSANVVGGAFDRATMAALDMASAGFGTAETNAVQLGKALNDPIKGINSLTRSGITFTAEEKKKIATLVESKKMLEAQNIVLAAIEKQVGGTAQATAKASDKIKVSMGQIAEAFAVPFSESFDKIPGKLESVFPSLSEVAARMGAYSGQALVDAMAGDYEKFATVGELLGDALKVGLLTAFQSVGTELVATVGKALDDKRLLALGPSGQLLNMAGKGLSGVETPGTGELLQANLINAKLKDQLDAILGEGGDIIQRRKDGSMLPAAELYAKNPEAPRGSAAQSVRAYNDASYVRDNMGGLMDSEAVKILRSIDRRLQPQP